MSSICSEDTPFAGEPAGMPRGPSPCISYDAEVPTWRRLIRNPLPP